jgi:hypothetical protein
MPAFSRSEAMTTSSFRGEPAVARCADLFTRGVCALGVASAAFALRFPAC